MTIFRGAFNTKSNLPRLEVEMPHGILTAEPVTDENYPGIELRIKGNPVALLEYDSHKGSFRLHAWKDLPGDDPLFTITYNRIINKEV